MWLLPAIQALLIQSASFVALLALLLLARSLAGIQVSLLVATLLQGALASFLSRLRHLARWWLVIQLLFPLALLATHALALPPTLFLIAFLLLLLVYWTVFRTRVPLYLSGAKVWEVIASLVPEQGSFHLVDIGCGLGGLLLYLEKQRPDASITGIELAPLPWLISRWRVFLAHSHIRIIRGDYGLLDFSQFDMVFAYLSPAVMDVLWQKAVAEMRPGALLLSYEFSIPGVKPDIVIQTGQNSSNLYGWRIPNISQQ